MPFISVDPVFDLGHTLSLLNYDIRMYGLLDRIVVVLVNAQTQQMSTLSSVRFRTWSPCSTYTDGFFFYLPQLAGYLDEGRSVNAGREHCTIGAEGAELMRVIIVSRPIIRIATGCVHGLRSVVSNFPLPFPLTCGLLHERA